MEFFDGISPYGNNFKYSHVIEKIKNLNKKLIKN
jgi:hypothetical protein